MIANGFRKLDRTEPPEPNLDEEVQAELARLAAQLRRSGAGSRARYEAHREWVKQQQDMSRMNRK